MPDIGGCRVVVRPPRTDLDGLAAAIAARWELLADDDYVADPRSSGYDTVAGRLTAVQEFHDPAAAADAVIALEGRYRDHPRMHVVMLTGESLESVKATHGTYFDDAADVVGSLTAAA